MLGRLTKFMHVEGRQYDRGHSPMKAIPTSYGGANFRSRLEARWAAFFDLAAIRWTYEPMDLDGWAPDFMLSTSACPIMVEVKPVDLLTEGYEQFAKAIAHQSDYGILLCGYKPFSQVPGKLIISDEHDLKSVARQLSVNFAHEVWEEAGSRVQWSAKQQKRAVIEAARVGDDRSSAIPYLTVGEREELSRARDEYQNGFGSAYLPLRLKMRSLAKERILDLFRAGEATREATTRRLAEYDLGDA